MRRFQLAYQRAVPAETLANEGKIHEAMVAWGKIFGDYFPLMGREIPLTTNAATSKGA